ASELWTLPPLLREGLGGEPELGRPRFGAFRDQPRRLGVEREQRWIEHSRFRGRQLRGTRLLRAELPEARRWYRDGRLPDHVLARVSRGAASGLDGEQACAQCSAPGRAA